MVPSVSASGAPSLDPSVAPSTEHVEHSSQPSQHISSSPSEVPSVAPASENPTERPSFDQSSEPSADGTSSPSAEPSFIQTPTPSNADTVTPSVTTPPQTYPSTLLPTYASHEPSADWHGFTSGVPVKTPTSPPTSPSSQTQMPSSFGPTHTEQPMASPGPSPYYEVSGEEALHHIQMMIQKLRREVWAKLVKNQVADDGK